MANWKRIVDGQAGTERRTNDEHFLDDAAIDLGRKRDDLEGQQNGLFRRVVG